MSPLTVGALDQKIEQNDEKHEEGHRRLRTDVRAIERRLDDIDKLGSATNLRLTRIESTPMDVTKLQFGTKTVIAIVVAAATIVIGQITMNATLKPDVLAMNTTTKEDVLKAIALQSQTIQAQSGEISDMKRELKMWQLKTEDLTKIVITLQARMK